MRKITVLFVLAFGLVWASHAHAALVFNADFAQDSAYDSSWPMKAGDVVTVDIYVSNVPEPGLMSMGFKLTYDSSKLEVIQAGTSVDMVKWPTAPYLEFIDVDEDGDIDEIDMAGFRMPGQAGNHIRLGAVTFRCIAEGTTEFKLLTRGEGYRGFVLDCDPETQNCALLVLDPTELDEEQLEELQQLLAELVLDGDVGPGVLLATIRPPISGDVNGDGLVNLVDGILILKVMAQLGQGEAVHTTGDVNGDGKIGLAEASYVLQRAAGLR